MLDYLRFILVFLRIYDPAIPLLQNLKRETGASRVIDLCSGGGGPMLKVQEELGIPAVLTDIYPAISSFAFLEKRSGSQISFVATPVNAMQVPGELKGLRTSFSAFHHFNEQQGIALLKDAVDAEQPIAVFDGGTRNFLIVIGILLHPLFIWIFTPFIGPFRLSKLFFTYLVPLIPLFTAWDGIISILRLYKHTLLLRMAEKADPAATYSWQAGTISNGLGIKTVYLIGLKTP